MVIQSHTLGNLASQFKKWVAPAIRARFQSEYFDENLGWMEGRYKSMWKFGAYARQQLGIGNYEFKKYADGFLKSEGADGLGRGKDQRAEDKLFGVYRTLGEIGIILSTMSISMLLDQILEGEDDDTDLQRRIKNLSKYQADRLYKETILFMPITPASWVQIQQMAKSPLAASRMLGELGEALNYSIWSYPTYLIQGEEAFNANSSMVYQNKPRKGQWKLSKAWSDAVPILTSLKKWENFLVERKFEY
jgi:hypothetical protein